MESGCPANMHRMAPIKVEESGYSRGSGMIFLDYVWVLLPTSLTASFKHLAGSWNPTPRQVVIYLLSLLAVIKCSICNSYSAYTLRLLNASSCIWLKALQKRKQAT